MNQEEVRKTYKILGHQKETEIRLIDPESDETKKKPPQSIFVSSEDEFVKVCAEFDGKYNIYVGINERKSKGTDQKDVITVSTIVIDIDPIRPKGLEKQASREEELNDALITSSQIVQDCHDKTEFKPPSVALSGNGVHLWFKIPLIEISDENRNDVEQKIKKFIQALQKKYNNNKIKIDQIGDLPRIIKVIGTKSIKGTPTTERPHRDTHWLTCNPEFDEELKKEILSIQLKESLIRNYVEPTKKTLQQIRGIFCSKKLQRLFDGDIEGYVSRSEAEMAIVCKLVEEEVPKEQVLEIMQSCRIGKWNEAHEQYRERTYNKAVSFVSENKKENLKDGDSSQEIAWMTAQQILSENRFLSFGDKERCTIYVYESGVYSENGKKRVRQQVGELLQDKASLHVKNEVLDHVYCATLVDELPEANVDLICLENGILNIFSKEFKPHSPDEVFFQKLPVKYESGLVCPVIKNFLEQVLKSEDALVIKKWVGYCLLREYRYHALLMLQGDGLNGKSTFLSLMKHFLGDSNIVSIPMQQLEKDRFSLVQLKGRLANIFADLPSESLSSTSMLKGLTGGDHFTCDQKFRETIGLVNYAKFMYSCNEIPELPEDTLAIWRRFILVRFPNTFPKDKADPLLGQKMAVEGELSGFLNYALEGLQTLVKDGGFEVDVQKTREDYIRLTDGVGSFVLDCLRVDVVSELDKENLYATYADYCREFDYDVLDESVFFKKLKKKVSIVFTRPRVDGRREQKVRGVNYKNVDFDTMRGRI